MTHPQEHVAELAEWAKEYKREHGRFRSLAVIFADPAARDEKAFERALWDRLQSLNSAYASNGGAFKPIDYMITDAD